MTTLENDILNESNFYFWEFNMRMLLAKKGLLHHIEPPSSQKVDANGMPIVPGDAQWKSADIKALANIARSMSPNLQAMVRSATTAYEAWTTLKTFFMKTNLHNKIRLRKELHEFRLSQGGDLFAHLTTFALLCTEMEGCGDVMSLDEKLVLLLGCLSSEYDAIVKIIENKGDATLLDAQEMLRREYQCQTRTERPKNWHCALLRSRLKECPRNESPSKESAIAVGKSGTKN
ncbi:TPA: hypothetical protein N0F65_009827 [Lagenidium giganteum]|uniref:Polyprotein n=1 Tax=Lagenidium giganteum TaxID=4803 RepID=A0AAV2YVQ2_9STRA|nr:TPA: hypothetical protein N0F65_009827 [Lagenidium giganteum]